MSPISPTATLGGAGRYVGIRAGSCGIIRRPAAQKSERSRASRRPKHRFPSKPDAPGLARNHRLILKDGTYQLVREYNIAGDRVRYLSLERGDWEEMPVELVDWDATRKWERDHAAPTGEEPSPAMKEAADIDKEEADERALQKARMPEVATGLELPDEDGVFALDTFQGHAGAGGADARRSGHGLRRTAHGVSVLNPLAASKANLELEGEHAKVHLHVERSGNLSLARTWWTKPSRCCRMR